MNATQKRRLELDRLRDMRDNATSMYQHFVQHFSEEDELRPDAYWRGYLASCLQMLSEQASATKESV